jgi:ADP-ribose pyrophosphatase YjhB (NUDIX family)
LRKSVGLVIITQEQNSIYSVLLQKRAEFNSEIGGRESYPGCLQVSCHGGVEEGEDFLDALKRELHEELGQEFSHEFHRSSASLHKVFEAEDDEMHVIIWAMFFPKERLLTTIRRGKDVGDLIYVSEGEIGQISPTTPDMRENGAPREKMVASPFAIEAIKKGLGIAKVLQLRPMYE